MKKLILLSTPVFCLSCVRNIEFKEGEANFDIQPNDSTEVNIDFTDSTSTFTSKVKDSLQKKSSK